MRTTLEVRSITKAFSGTKALDQVNLQGYAGELVALLGENGAGKSTLMKVICGVYPAGTFEGALLLEGKELRLSSTKSALSAGIAMIHQELSSFPELTVAENLSLSRLSSWIDYESLFQKTQEFLDTIGFDLSARSRLKDLSVGNRQLVEIARAIYQNSQVIIFDEPTSALTEGEIKTLYQVVDQLKGQGKTIFYITHRFDEVFRLANRILVLRDGRNAGEMHLEEVRKHQTQDALEAQLISWMVGRPLSSLMPPKNEKIGEEIFRVQNLTVRSKTKSKPILEKISFAIKKGEIIGLGGLLGAGRSETLESLFGVFYSSGPRSHSYGVQGEVWMHGTPFSIQNPSRAISSRMAYVSEDRKKSGLILHGSVRSNMNLLKKGPWWSLIHEGKEKKETQKWIQQLSIKTSSMEQPVSQLSGGNQQKVILAKWLMIGPEILFLDEPTRGIDVGAKAEIYRWIQSLASEGLAIVLASSEMAELLGLCHRILVLKDGKLSAEFESSQTTQEDILKAASL